MKNSGEQRGWPLRPDGEHGYRYLAAAVVRQAIADGDWEFVREVGIHMIELIGISPECFTQKVKIHHGRNL